MRNHVLNSRGELEGINREGEGRTEVISPSPSSICISSMTVDEVDIRRNIVTLSDRQATKTIAPIQLWTLGIYIHRNSSNPSNSTTTHCGHHKRCSYTNAYSRQTHRQSKRRKRNDTRRRTAAIAAATTREPFDRCRHSCRQMTHL